MDLYSTDLYLHPFLDLGLWDSTNKRLFLSRRPFSMMRENVLAKFSWQSTRPRSSPKIWIQQPPKRQKSTKTVINCFSIFLALTINVIYICVCVYLFNYLFIYLFIYLMYLCIYVFMYLFIHSFIHLFICTYVNKCVYIYIYIYI